MLLVLIASLSGCGGGGGSSSGSGGGSNPPPQGAKKWTFLVYMNAANDLEEFSGLNINQMEQIGSTDNVNIVVQVKRIGNKYDTGFPDWKDTDTRRFYIQPDNDTSRIHSELLWRNNNVDMGKASTLRDFIQWGVQTYPAQRYCLVLWNHGAGWRSVKTRAAVGGRGISYDDVTGSHIDTIELPAAMDIGRKWDVLAFDASLMQIAEVAYEIRDRAEYITGSEESPPGEGYPYYAFLTRLVQNPDIATRDFAVAIAQDTITAYTNGIPVSGGVVTANDITQSVLDASRVAAIAPAVNNLGSALLSAKTQYGTQIAQARNLAESYAYPQNKDLIHFTELLTAPTTGTGAVNPGYVPDPAVQAAANQVRAVVSDALVINVNGRRHPDSNGLAIFLPSPSSYRRIDEEQADGFGQRYGLLAFTQAAPNWQAFLVQGPP